MAHGGYADAVASPAHLLSRDTEQVTAYHWLVVIIGSAGSSTAWTSACSSWRASRPFASCSARRWRRPKLRYAELRDDSHDPRLGDWRDPVWDDERPMGPREDDGGHVARLLGVHGPFRDRADVAGLHDLPVSCRARCRRYVRRRHDARGGERPGPHSRYGARRTQALSALGNILGSLISLRIQPGADDLLWDYSGWRVLFFVGILPSVLVVPMLLTLREPGSGGVLKRKQVARRAERRIGDGSVPFTQMAAQHGRRSDARRVWDDRFVGDRLFLARADLHRPSWRAAETTDTVRGWGTALQDVGAFSA